MGFPENIHLQYLDIKKPIKLTDNDSHSATSTGPASLQGIKSGTLA